MTSCVDDSDTAEVRKKRYVDDPGLGVEVRFHGRRRRRLTWEDEAAASLQHLEREMGEMRMVGGDAPCGNITRRRRRRLLPAEDIDEEVLMATLGMTSLQVGTEERFPSGVGDRHLQARSKERAAKMESDPCDEHRLALNRREFLGCSGEREPG